MSKICNFLLAACVVAFSALGQTAFKAVTVSTNVGVLGAGALAPGVKLTLSGGVVSNSTAVNLTGSLTNVTANGTSLRPVWPQTPYSVYAPTITNRYIVNQATAPWQYNHDASLAYFGDRWFAQWNANTNQYESTPGQVNLQSTSTDFVTWSTPVEVFNSATTSLNPVTVDYAATQQWQPNLIVVGDELWSLWMNEDETGLSYPQGWTMYFSRLTSATGKWTNTALALNYTENGITFYGFPTQNPIQLRSGRVLAPVVWVATNHVSPLPNGWAVPTAFWTQEKRAGVIYTDDGGTTWEVGGVTTLPGYNYAVWEPVVQQSDDGTLRIYVRNLDYINFDNSQYLTTALGYADGLAFGPLETLSFDTTSSRLGHMFQPDDGFGRHLYLLNDWQAGGFVSDRYNGSIAFSRSGKADITPGVSFSGSEQVVGYPQGVVKDDKVYIIYSQGSVPRNMKTAVIDPAPSTDTYYILPRSNDYVNPQVAYTAGPPAYLTHTLSSTMYSVTNTAGWTATNASVGAWVYRTATAGSEVFIDTRDLDERRGFAFGLFADDLFLTLYQSGAAVNFNFTTLTVPLNAWTYVGLTIDPAGAGAVAYMVSAAGTATTQTIALTTHDGLNAGVAYIGRAQPGSSLIALQGRVRHLVAINGVSASANNHRYWHGLDQAALSASDWAGTETDPGTPFYDYDAGSADAGTNNEDWLLAWSATGSSIRGTATAGTVDGRSAVSITGTGSAGVELPPFQRGQQLVWSTRLFVTNKTSGFDQVLATIGSRAGQILVLSRTNNPTLVEAYSADSGRYAPLGNYLTNQWVPLTVLFDGSAVELSWDDQTAVRMPLTVTAPVLFLGQGYLDSRDLSPADGMAADIEATGFHVAALGTLSNADVDPEFRAATFMSAQPTLTFIDTDANVTNTIYGAGSSIRADRYGVNVMTLSTATGEMDLVGSNVRYQATSVDTTPVFIGTRGNGSSSSITVATNGQALAVFYGSGYTDTNTEGSASGGMIVAATEDFTPTAKGALVGIQTTPNGSTTRATTHLFYASGNAAFSGSWLTVGGNNVALAPAVGTLSYSGSDVTVTAGKGPLQEDTLTAAGNFNLLFTSLATRDAGTILVWPAATNCTVTLPSYAKGPTGSTLTITGGTGYTNHTEIAWKNLVVGGTNRVSINALNYY